MLLYIIRILDIPLETQNNKSISRRDFLKFAIASPFVLTENPVECEIKVGALYGIKHDDVRATTFWAGEEASEDNMGISNIPSAWYSNWPAHFGGIDNPENRDPKNSYFPEGFTPKENPFYVAIPIQEFTETGEAPYAHELLSDMPYVGKDNAVSRLKNQWVKISYNDKKVYAQVADIGPIPDGAETDVGYILGQKPYVYTEELEIGGIDMSPAVTIYLTEDEERPPLISQTSLEGVSWELVPPECVPEEGPWNEIVTESGPHWE